MVFAASFPARMISGRRTPILLLVAILMATIGLADDSPNSNTPVDPPKSPLVDEFGDPLERLESKQPVSDADQKLDQAASWYMSGRIMVARGQNSEALDAFRKAIAADPAAIPAYQSAIPILLNIQKSEEAKELALSAAEHTPAGFQLISTMAGVLAQQNNLTGSIELLKSAFSLPTFQPESETDFLISRDLGLYLRLNDELEPASLQYEKVLNAVRSGKFDADAVKRILREPGATLDEFGDVFVKASKPELALAAYDEANKYREATPGLHSFNLALVFRQTGKPQEALAELEKYLSAQQQQRGRAAYDLLTGILKDLGKSEELLPRLEKLREADARNDALRYYLADAYTDADRLDDALKLYQSEGQQVRDPRGLVGVFGIARRRGNVELLLQLLSTAMQNVPRANDDEVLQRLAPDVQELSRRFEKELTSLKEDDGLFGELLDAVRKQRQEDETKLEFFRVYTLGKLSIEAERTDDAVEFYRLAISMRNEPPSLLYSEPALHLLDVKRYDLACELLQEALNNPSGSLQDDRWRMLFFLSYGEEFRGSTEAALTAIREARKLQPDMSRLAFQEAWVQYHARRWDDALVAFNKVIADFPKEKDLIADCQFRISNIYVEQGDMDKGEQVLVDLLASDPENTQANNDLGYLWADRGKNLDQAKVMIEKALKSDPENPAYLDSLGWVLYRLEDFEGAARNLQSATEQKNGDDATIYDHLGDALNKLGKADEARAAWKKAIELEMKNTSPDEDLRSKLKMKLGE